MAQVGKKKLTSQPPLTAYNWHKDTFFLMSLMYILRENSHMKCLIISTKVFELTKSPWPRKYSSCLSYLVFMPSSKYWFSFDSSSVPCCDLNCDCPFVFFNFPTIKADHSGMLTTWHFEFIELCSRHSCSGLVVSKGGRMVRSYITIVLPNSISSLHKKTRYLHIGIL